MPSLPPRRRPSRPALILLVAAAGLAVGLAGRIDLPATGGIKGDEATYIGMAASLAFDGDLHFAAEDYQRFRQWYGSGPEGIFLKQDANGTLHFGKAYTHAVLAAPFARGGPRGLFVFNALCLVVIIAAAIWWLSARSNPGPAALYSVAFTLAAVTPLYAAWLTSDLVTYALVAIAFAIGWPRDRAVPSRVRALVALLILSAAIFSKPLNVLLALPLALAVATTWTMRTAALTVCGLGVALLFGINGLVTGDLNYQGGARKAFYGHFPYDDDGHDFDSAGILMTTNTVNTPVGAEGRVATLGANVGYFFVGRHFGLAAFGWPWLVCVGLWAVCRRGKTLAEWALFTVAGGVATATIMWMPYTWSGGGGPVGNRYFLSVAAALFVLTPPIRNWIPGTVALTGLLFVGPALAQPLVIARQPWLATQAPQFGVLPIELTGASDLPIVLDQRRGRIPQGRDPMLMLSLFDERADIGRGGWIAVTGGHRTEILVRSPEWLEAMTVGVKSDTACELEVNGGDRSTRIVVPAGGRQDWRIPVRQVFSREAFVFVLDVDARRCESRLEIAVQGHRRDIAAGRHEP